MYSVWFLLQGNMRSADLLIFVDLSNPNGRSLAPLFHISLAAILPVNSRCNANSLISFFSHSAHILSGCFGDMWHSTPCSLLLGQYMRDDRPDGGHVAAQPHVHSCSYYEAIY